TFDADGQHDEDDIPRLVRVLTREHRDVALASRFLGREALGMPRSKRLLLKGAVLYMRLTTGLPITDAHNGLRAFRAEVAPALRRLFVLVFFGGGIVFILQPDLTTTIANVVGIGRGADLIFYLSTLFLFFLCFNYHVRFMALEEQLTRIVRELAVRHPVHEED